MTCKRIRDRMDVKDRTMHLAISEITVGYAKVCMLRLEKFSPRITKWKFFSQVLAEAVGHSFTHSPPNREDRFTRLYDCDDGHPSGWEEPCLHGHPCDTEAVCPSGDGLCHHR